MIERWIKNDLSLKRWKRFRTNKPAMISIWVLLIITFFSMTAELWSNSKPIAMKYKGELYLPLVKEYHPTLFGREDIFVMDYRSLVFEDSDWAVWPLNKWDPFEANKNVESYPAPPSRDNIMGTDDRGRDVFSRLLYGFRYALSYSLGVWFFSYILGAFLGSIMGYYGGRIDLLGSRAVEIIENMPFLMLLITIISIFSPGILLLIFFTVIFDWTEIFHQIRGQFLQLRKRDFVDSAKALGAKDLRIILNHILPNAITPLVTLSPFAIAANISSLAFLDYLGLGLQAPTPSWGELMGQAQKWFTIAEWLVWYPGLALVITMVSLILIGQAIRDAFDSRTYLG